MPKNKPEAKSKSPPMSPEDKLRHELRLKRLARLSSDKTGEASSYGEGSMVKVDSLGYGVVRCLKEMKTKSGHLIAGIEFVRQ